MNCPNCGEDTGFTESLVHSVETHGLDCGPYEHWDEWVVQCNSCGAKTDWDEIAKSQPTYEEHADG